MARSTSDKTVSESTTKRSTRKAKKTSSHDERIVKNGRGLSTLVKKHHRKIVAYNAKLFPAGEVTKFGGLLRQTTTSIAEHQSGTRDASYSVAEKRAAITSLVTFVVTLREEVRLATPGDTKLHEALGAGMRLSPKIAKDAIAIAALQQKTFEGNTHGAAMRRAGITQARIKTLEATRRTAAIAEAAEGEATGQKSGEAKTKDALVRELGKWNTRVIGIGALVFKDDPKICRQFEQYRLKRSRRLATKTSPAAPTTPPPATP